MLQEVERSPGMLGGARRPCLVETVRRPTGRHLPARRNLRTGIIGVEIGGGARGAGIDERVLALLVGIDVRALCAATGFAARTRGHEDAGEENDAELELIRTVLSDPVVIPWFVLWSSVNELGELGPPLECLLRGGSVLEAFWGRQCQRGGLAAAVGVS